MNQQMSAYDAATVARLVAQATTDLCEHVAADPTKAVVVHRESDSFGPVCDVALCKECDDAAQAAHDAEVVTCPDCGKEVRQDETRTWKWYDFYAAQGDEPMVICKACWGAAKHQDRMARDDQARDEEMDYLRGDSCYREANPESEEELGATEALWDRYEEDHPGEARPVAV